MPLKRARLLDTAASKSAQPAHKKPPQNDTAISESALPAHKNPPQNNPVTDPPPPTIQAEFLAIRVRNQDKEKEVEKRVCDSLPRNIDHWFYDLRDAGTVPPESLVAASRAMVLNWKSALGEKYFPFGNYAGGMVLNLEHAHRSYL
jgi:hypothetical protein